MILKAQLMVQLIILTLTFESSVEAKATPTSGHRSAIEDDLASTTHPTEASETDVVGCPTDEGFLPLGEDRSLEGCAELFCVHENHTLSLYIRRCEIAPDQIEDGCKIVPRPELEFPKCCEVVIECKIITTSVHPVFYTAANISLLERNDSDNTIFKEQYILNLPQNQTLPKLNLTPKVNGKLHTHTIKDRRKREVDADQALVKEYDQQEEGCETGNGILKPMQYIPLKDCAQLKCIPDQGGFSLVIVRCDMSENKTTPEGCTLNPKPEQQYPDCCTLEYLCEKVVSKLVPVTFTAANISQLEINTDANLLELKTVDKENGPLIRIVSENSNTDPSKRKTRATPETQTTGEEGCVTENGLLKTDQKIPLDGCSQLVCVPDNDTFSSRILSCNLPEEDIEEGCEIIPRPELKFPECCEIVMVCHRVVTTVFPVLYDPANISLLESNDIDNIIPPDEDFLTIPGVQNPPNEMVINQNPLESLNDRERRDTELENANLKEEVGCVTENGTLKPNEEIPFQECGKLTCSYAEGELVLVAESCSPPKLPDNLEACTVISTPDVPFPECCSVLTYVCKKVVETLIPVVYTAQNISDLQGNVTLNLVDEIDAAEDHGQDDTRLEISPDESDFKELKHSSSKSKSILKSRIRRDTKQTESTTNTGSQREVDKNEKITKNVSVKKAKSRSDKKEKVTTQKESKLTPEKNVKEEKNEGKPYDYKTFIERNRRNAKLSETKPTFFLPLSRRQSSRKREISISDRKIDADDLKLKDSMFVTSTPKPHSNESIKILEDKEKVKTNNIKKEDRNKKMGRLSALLSSRNLRVTTEAPKEEEKKNTRRKTVRGNEKKETKKKEEVEKKSEVKETPTRRPRLRNRLAAAAAAANSTDLTQVAERRRLYASRLNRFRANVRNKVGNEDKSESTKKEVIRKKEQKEADEKKDEKETPKSRREQSKTNFSLRRRFNNRRRGKSVTDEETKNEDKKEETKKLPIRSRLNRKQKEDVKKEKADDEKSSTVVNQRRRKPDASKVKTEAKTKAETKKTKTTLKRTRTKPSARIKSLRIKNKTPDAEEKSDNNEKKPNDSKRLRGDKTTKTPNKTAPRARVSSRSRNLRRRLQEQKKRKEAEASKKKEESKQTKSKLEKESKATTVKETKPESSKETKPESAKKEQPVVKTHTEILKDSKEDQKPIKQIHEIPYYPSFHEKDGPVATSPPLYEPEYDSEYPFVPKFKSRLDDFDKFYTYPEEDEELGLSSSHKEQAEKSPNTEENEIPDVPEVPMKITTVSFSTSRRSFKSSKSRNTSKNFKETPTVYDNKESFKSTKFR